MRERLRHVAELGSFDVEKEGPWTIASLKGPAVPQDEL
jgi:hypothetical protein